MLFMCGILKIEIVEPDFVSKFLEVFLCPEIFESSRCFSGRRCSSWSWRPWSRCDASESCCKIRPKIVRLKTNMRSLWERERGGGGRREGERDFFNSISILNDLSILYFLQHSKSTFSVEALTDFFSTSLTGFSCSPLRMTGDLIDWNEKNQQSLHSKMWCMFHSI